PVSSRPAVSTSATSSAGPPQYQQLFPAAPRTPESSTQTTLGPFSQAEKQMYSLTSPSSSSPASWRARSSASTFSEPRSWQSTLTQTSTVRSVNSSTPG